MCTIKIQNGNYAAKSVPMPLSLSVNLFNHQSVLPLQANILIDVCHCDMQTNQTSIKLILMFALELISVQIIGMAVKKKNNERKAKSIETGIICSIVVVIVWKCTCKLLEHLTLYRLRLTPSTVTHSNSQFIPLKLKWNVPIGCNF